MDNQFKARPISDLLEAREEQERREESIGDEIVSMRRAIGMSQAFLAEAAGVSPSYLNRIEKGKKRASTGTLRNLLHVLEGETHGESQESK